MKNLIRTEIMSVMPIMHPKVYLPQSLVHSRDSLGLIGKMPIPMNK